jgi:hypothetical protein
MFPEGPESSIEAGREAKRHEKPGFRIAVIMPTSVSVHCVIGLRGPCNSRNVFMSELLDV